MIGETQDKTQKAVYKIALDSHAAALNVRSLGVTAEEEEEEEEEEVHAAHVEVLQSNGYDNPFRCGRGTGFSSLEKPQLVTGDKTVLQPGMVLAVDASVSINTFRTRIGDSSIITEDGYEPLTSHPKGIDRVTFY